MALGLGVWFGAGIIHLIILTYQDVKNKMLVDDRHNWLMKGLGIGLLMVVDYTIIYLVTLILVLIVLNKYLKKIKAIGEADINTITWSFYGFGLIDWRLLIFYVVVLGFLFAINHLLKLAIIQQKNKSPAYPVFLVAFSLTAGFYSLLII